MILYTDVLIPVIGFVLLWLQHRYGARARPSVSLKQAGLNQAKSIQLNLIQVGLSEVAEMQVIQMIKLYK